MSQQKTLLLLEKQGALAIRKIDIPKPGPALNPVDFKIQRYGAFHDKFPTVLGMDVAGIVEQVGEGVTAFKKGDKVLHECTFKNNIAGFQEYTTAPEDIVAKVGKLFTNPPGIVFDAISLADTQSQAWNALGPNGTLVLVLPAQPDITSGEHGKTALTTFGLIYDEHRELGRSLFANLTQLLESEKIKPNSVEVLPSGLAGIEPGFKRMTENKVSGAKLVVRPQETP